MTHPVPSPVHPSWLRRHGVKLAASLIIALGFGWLLHAGALPLLPPRSALDDVKWWTVVVYAIAWCAVHVLRAARWAFLLAPLHPVPLRRIIAVSFVGFAAIVLLPFRTGEAVRPMLIRKRGQLSGWAATGTIGAERIIDGLFLSGMLLAALTLTPPIDPLPDRIGNLPVSASLVPRAAYLALAVFGVAFATMGLFYWRRHFARRLTHRIVGIVSHKAAEWLATRVENVAEGLRFLREVRYSVPFILATALYWLLNAAGTWLLCWGCGLPDYTFGRACVTTGVLALGILVPNAPGFFGAYQISLYASFAMYYQASDVTGPGAAYVFVAYILQLLITIIAGIWGMAQEHTGVAEALDEG
jgi:glycosyltransferase 2 family protein